MPVGRWTAALASLASLTLVLCFAAVWIAAAAPKPPVHRTPAAVKSALAAGPHAGDCGQCHSGHAEDQPEPYAPLLAGPNENSLCASCHDTPWAGGSYPDLPLYTGSAHGSSPEAVWPGSMPPARGEPGAAGKCLNCHDPHGWSDYQGEIPFLGVAREEKLCLQCHDGSPAGTNIRADFQLTYRHPTMTLEAVHRGPAETGQADFGYAPENRRHAECPDCHNPHVARGESLPPSGDEASKRLLGVSRIAVLNGPAGAPPAYTFIPASDTLSRPGGEYQLCFKCHSSWTTQPPGQSDLAMKLNTNNPSFHPVEAAGTDLSIRPDAFTPGWTAFSRVTCSDCHGSDFGARGPHGSSYPAILRKPFDTKSSGYLAFRAGMPKPAAAELSSNSDELCFQCHSYDVYANELSSSAVQSASRFNKPANSGGHAMHVGELGVSCYACHDSHGSATNRHLIVTGRSPGLDSYSEWAGGGSCAPSCHIPSNYGINYAR
jgi:predicted CXXCH cytochrome family protein